MMLSILLVLLKHITLLEHFYRPIFLLSILLVLLKLTYFATSSASVKSFFQYF